MLEFWEHLPHSDTKTEGGSVFRRQREWHDIMADPRTPYMIGRLIGASEMGAVLLAQEGESENAKRVGMVLQTVGGYFMESVPDPTRRASD